MSNNVTAVSVHILPGQRVKIKPPLDETNKGGYFSWPSSRDKVFKENLTIPKESIIRGFWVEYSDVGEIEEDPDYEQGVIYTHKKMDTNAVWFFTSTNKAGVCNIISVAPHDHSTIVTGGPAYATYFSDEEI